MKKIALFFLLMVIVACSSESLSVKQATNLIKTHTEKYPYFEKTTLQLGEQKYSVRKDSAEITVLRNLASQDLISLQTIKSHKKLLSKDSVLVVNIGLTTKAADFVIDQKKNKAQVKTYLFTIQENSDVQLELNSKTKATASAKLIKTTTPFAGLSKDKNPNTAFIVRDFTLRYKEETGWFVQK